MLSPTAGYVEQLEDRPSQDGSTCPHPKKGFPMSVPVYDQLRALVLSDEFGPDTMLVETALATRLGVSRTPIREALRRLEQDGLIERTSRGTRVGERSPEQILEIYELRILLEGQAASAGAAVSSTFSSRLGIGSPCGSTVGFPSFAAINSSSSSESACSSTSASACTRSHGTPRLWTRYSSSSR